MASEKTKIPFGEYEGKPQLYNAIWTKEYDGTKYLSGSIKLTKEFKKLISAFDDDTVVYVNINKNTKKSENPNAPTHSMTMTAD